MLTARTAAVDRISGLEAGADDYLPKPFGPEELVARIRAVLRRAVGADAGAAARSARGGGGSTDPGGARGAAARGHGERDHHRVRHPGATRPLRRADRLSRRADRPAVPRKATPFDRVLDVHVSHLRKKLGRHGELIRTVRGAGYLFRIRAEADGDEET